MAQRAVASGNRRVRDPRSRAADRERAGRARRFPTGPGAVELRDVSLAYNGGAPALEDVELRSSAGERWRSSVRSASGKTSLVALLARLYDPTRGAVLVDGADLRTVDVASLRSQIAFVADDSFLFSATVAENIAYAQPGGDAGGDRARGAPRAGARLHRAAPRRLRRRWSASAA